MAADPNMNFLHGSFFPQSFCNQRVVSFQSGAVNSGAGMIPGGMDSSGGISVTAGMIVAGNPNMMNYSSSMISPCDSPGNIVLDPVSGLKHGTGLAVNWSDDELAVLREGLDKYANEQSLMKYIKIAARLPDKTVRDVAMRCRWMTKKESSKRRKPEEFFSGKKIKDRKEKMIDASSLHPIQPENKAAYPFMMQHVNPNSQFSCEAPPIDSTTRHLLYENIQLINQIATNLATFKIQHNIDLFHRTRNNIASILHSMSEMPGIMSRMPPLPVPVNDDLVNLILSSTTEAHAPSSSHLKEEPRCW